MGESRTSRQQQVINTRCLCGAMVQLLLSAGMMSVNAIFHHWMLDSRTSRLQQGIIIRCLCGAMEQSWPSARMLMVNATFPNLEHVGNIKSSVSVSVSVFGRTESET